MGGEGFDVAEAGCAEVDMLVEEHISAVVS